MDDLHLLLVGPEDPTDPPAPQLVQRLREDKRVHFVGHVTDTAPYYSLMNVLALPSHREGFGMAALEASACQVPVVGTRIAGLSDAIAVDVSGALIPVNAPEALADALERYLRDPDLAARQGAAGRRRALAAFSPSSMWQEVRALYAEELA